MRKPRKPPDQVLAPSRVIDEDVFYEASLGPTFAEMMLKHKTDRLKRGDVARFLAVIAVLHQKHGHVPDRFQSAVNAPVPVEVIEILGKLLVGTESWSAKYNRPRTKPILPNVRKEIEAYLRQYPTASKRRIAKRFGVSRKKI
jgi:hypothetical protein